MSDFRARKVRSYFAKIDRNNDGFISKKDAEDVADRYSDAENVSQEQRQQLKRDYVERTDPVFKEAYFKTLHSFFDVLDLNGDGYLSKDEFARAATSAGFEDNSFVHTAFEYMDANKDGKLSVNEYTSAFYKYLTTEDEHLLFGPLV